MELVSQRHSRLFRLELTWYVGDGSGTATFSGRREGLALYFARLVRPFWKVLITKAGYVFSALII